jgi:hypothetical protein
MACARQEIGGRQMPGIEKIARLYDFNRLLCQMAYLGRVVIAGSGRDSKAHALMHRMVETLPWRGGKKCRRL